MKRILLGCSWIEDYETSSASALATPATQNLTDQDKIVEGVVSHPFLALRMLERYSVLKSLLEPTWSEQSMEAYMKDMANETNDLPDLSDYEDAMWNIINLRYVYDLNVSDVSQLQYH
jgi:hypothetical protein